MGEAGLGCLALPMAARQSDPSLPGCREITAVQKVSQNTILCIDDDRSMLGYQRALLERRGFALLTAASARQGLQIAAACAVAAVIVDYHMPEMNGHELATEMKRLRPEVPIVMVTSDDNIAEYALKVVDAFVSKSEAPSRLLPVITRICGETHRLPALLN